MDLLDAFSPPFSSRMLRIMRMARKAFSVRMVRSMRTFFVLPPMKNSKRPTATKSASNQFLSTYN